MSFANLDLEAQTPVSKRSLPNSKSNELDGIIVLTAQLIQRFGQLVLTFDSQRKTIGTRRDCESLRSNIEKLVADIYKLSQAISDLLARLSHALLTSDPDDLQTLRRQTIIKDRLSHDHEDLERKFEAAIKSFNEKKNTVPLATESTRLKPDSPSVNYGMEPQSQSQIQEQEQRQLLIDEAELQYHTLLTQEREREINSVAEGISQVNAIFRDLGALVNQQGEQLDTVENSITQYLDNTRGADRELVTANAYQRKKGKWTCILLTALCIATLVVVLVVLS